MDMVRTLRCAIEDIDGWYPRLFLEPHCIACAAVMGRYSESPATFNVVCDDIHSSWLGPENEIQLEVSWKAETAAKADRLLATMQQKPVVELASIALAFILARRLLALGRLDLNDYGDRADYRSLRAQSVLEISGTEDLSELRFEGVKSGLSAYLRIGVFPDLHPEGRGFETLSAHSKDLR